MGEVMVKGPRKVAVLTKTRKVAASSGRDDSWMRRPGDPELPAWLEARDYQLDAVERIVKEYEAGARVVMLDAPTGTGKTAIAELTRRRLAVPRGLYVCTTKSLQDQVDHDFPYAQVLKGRANYVPNGLSGPDDPRMLAGGRGGVTCQDCDRSPVGVPMEEQDCSWCVDVERCPYLVAREGTRRAPVGVLNTSYLLTECNGPGTFKGQEFVVADECDRLEDELLGYVEYRMSAAMARDIGVEIPKAGSHMTTIRRWLSEQVVDALINAGKAWRKRQGLEAQRQVLRLTRLANSTKRVLEREDGWVRDDDRDGLVLKPVYVDDVAGRYLWDHSDRWLLMSGTIVSAENQADVLGLERAEVPWALVEVPMRFKAENRRVVYVPAGKMTRKGQEAGGTQKVLRAIERVLQKHPWVQVLIHAHSYQLAREIEKAIPTMDLPVKRTVIHYDSARGRDKALEVFKAAARQVDEGRRPGAVLVAASMDRGIDLPGNLCRVQIIAKVPMASLGDRQVSERLHQPGGEVWYLANTVRTIMQMCGRAVRGEDDWAVTYILDSHFGGKDGTLSKGKRLGMWPQWWLDGLETGKIREYV